jgi:UPF0716 protein FxsA
MPILLLVLLFPVIEILLLVSLASHIGLMATLLYLIASALLGSWMLRNQELGALLTLGSVMRQGRRVSIYSLLWPIRYAFAGVLFIIPGILSEIAGILLLLPLKGPEVRSTSSQAQSQDNDVIEGEFRRVDDAASSLGHPEDRDR